MTGADWLALAPVLALLGAALAVIGVGISVKPGSGALSRSQASALEWIAYAGVIASIFLLRLNEDPDNYRKVLFGGSLISDPLSMFISLAILIATALTILVSADSMVARGVQLAEYIGLLLIAATGMILLVMSGDLITMFLSIEILSVALYVLCGITRTDGRSNEAAMKYFVLGAFATGFLLYGMTLLYGATGSVFFLKMDNAFHANGVGPVALTGLCLIIVGFAFKIGAAPFHMWVPDVYEGAPTPITGFMSVAVKAAGFAALIRLLVHPLHTHAEAWSVLIWGLAVLTMAVGNLGALTQTSVKRMLAYSSVAHTGYALIGILGAVPAGSHSVVAEGPVAATFYMFVYTLMTLGAFVFLMWAGKPATPGVPAKEAETFDDLAGLAKRRPWAAAFMTIFMLSLAGIPPLAGFFGKFLLFKSAVGAGYLGTAIFGIAMSVVSIYYYVRVIVVMYMHDPFETPEAAAKAAGEPAPSDFNVGLAVGIAAVLTLLLGLYPNFYINMAKNAIEALLH